MKSNFSFVNNEIRRQNLDDAFDYIVTLLPFTESVSYNEPAKSAFCKTIIIYTASIVEALLFHLLDSKFTDSDIVDFYSSWELKDKKELYIVNDSHKIVSGDYKKVLGKTSKAKMNLAQISDFLKAKKIIDKNLHTDIDTIRILRNEQHFGVHKKVHTYTKNNIENSFFIASKVKNFVKKKCAKK